MRDYGARAPGGASLRGRRQEPREGVASAELTQIEESIATLRAEADLIRGMIGTRDGAGSSGPVPLRVSPDAARHSGGKLTAAERRTMYQIIGDLMAKGEVTPTDVVAEAERRGIRLRSRWALPESAVGTMLHFARKKKAS